MDAPIYLPASAYSPPRVAPYVASIATLSIGDLMAWPAAWAIVMKHIPMVKMMVGSEQFAPNAGNLRFSDLEIFAGNLFGDKLPLIDAELAALPSDGKPGL